MHISIRRNTHYSGYIFVLIHGHIIAIERYHVRAGFRMVNIREN